MEEMLYRQQNEIVNVKIDKNKYIRIYYRNIITPYLKELQSPKASESLGGFCFRLILT